MMQEREKTPTESSLLPRVSPETITKIKEIENSLGDLQEKFIEENPLLFPIPPNPFDFFQQNIYGIAFEAAQTVYIPLYLEAQVQGIRLPRVSEETDEVIVSSFLSANDKTAWSLEIREKRKPENPVLFDLLEKYIERRKEEHEVERQKGWDPSDETVELQLNFAAVYEKLHLQAEIDQQRKN